RHAGRRRPLQHVGAREGGGRPPQSAFYLWQRHAVSSMRWRRYACGSEVKDPERQVKSIARLRSLYAEGTTPNLSFLSTTIDKGIVGRDPQLREEKAQTRPSVRLIFD